jgi:sulfotransferase 6B1
MKQQGRLIRHQSRRAAVRLRWRRLSLAGLPVIFGNSFPKSGTHLLSQILEGFQGLGPAANAGLPVITMYDNLTGAQQPVTELERNLKRLQPGDIGFGHLHALPELSAILGGKGYATYFILRDPRDVVVSHVYYVTEMEPDHFHHRYYTEQLSTFDERVRTSILGLPGEAAPFPDIRGRFEPFLGWLGLPEVLCLRFEDLVQDLPGSLGKILDHALARGFPLEVPRTQAIQQLQKAVNPSRSPTFRSGKTGGWVEQFSLENKALFKQVAGDLLIRLGYEKNLDW